MKFITYIIYLLIIYIVIAFLALELNPLEWGWFGRLVFTFLILSGMSIFGEDDW